MISLVISMVLVANLGYRGLSQHSSLTFEKQDGAGQGGCVIVSEFHVVIRNMRRVSESSLEV